MVKATIEIPENENRVLNIVKGQYGLRTKEQAVTMIIRVYGEEILESELRPEYVEKLMRIDKEEGIPFKNIEELRKLTGE